jgi:hypothetical protein
VIRIRSLPTVLALNRTVGIVLVSVLFFGLGEQLWSPFFPAYLDAKMNGSAAGAIGGVSLMALLAVGIYACVRNLFEAACYVGGGQLTARLGDRGSLILFGALTVAGYFLFLTWTAPVVAVIAALLIVGWEPLSVPVTFTTVATTVTAKNQGMAFALQSIQKRLPRIVGPAIAGLVLAAASRHHGSSDIGYVVGMRWLVGASLLSEHFIQRCDGCCSLRSSPGGAIGWFVSSSCSICWSSVESIPHQWACSLLCRTRSLC